MEDYTLISCFKLLGDTPIEKIERNSKKYVIITDLNIDDKHVLFRKREIVYFIKKLKMKMFSRYLKRNKCLIL
jgi:hypothetical protein